jgi:hypothetical protein
VFIGRGMSLVLHYPERLEAKRLAASLEEVLKAVPLFAGGLVEREDGRYGVGPLGHAVERLEVREMPSLPEELDAPLALRELVPRLLTGPGQPMLAVQLTLAPRDSVLAVTVLHAVADAFGLFLFMRAWARAAVGRPFEAPPTDRRLQTFELPEPTAPLTPEDVWRRTGFTWRPGHPRRLDAPLPTGFGTRIIPPDMRALAGDEPLSDNDVLCAWLVKTHARVLAGPLGLAVAMTVGYRQSHGGLPRNYLGNAFRAAPLWLPREVLERESILEVAARVQQATRSSFGEQAARDSLACLEQLLREQGPQVVRELHLAHPHQGVLVTNISRLPFGIIDFGQGPADWARLPAQDDRAADIQQAEEELEVSLLLGAN